MTLKSHLDGGGLYVHIPFCRTKCRYCSFYSEPITKHNEIDVIRAMLTQMQKYEIPENIETIYIGGGSPSCIAESNLFELVKVAKEYCPNAEEFTIEINPGQANEQTLNRLRKAGVNRISIGAQSFIQSELDFLARSHTVENIYEAVRFSRAAGFDNINLDLIFAIPYSDLDSWKYNLNAAIESDVEHISAYALTYEDKTPLVRDLAAGLFAPIDEDTDRAMYELTIDEFSKAGIEQYEISNFAKSGFKCRHNLNYWANGDYFGIGPAAASYLQGQRSVNFAGIESYVKAIKSGADAFESSEILNERQRACETAVLNLRRISGIDLTQFKTQTGFDAMELFAEPISAYKKQGFLDSDGQRIFLTRRALGIADLILCDFSVV